MELDPPKCQAHKNYHRSHLVQGALHIVLQGCFLSPKRLTPLHFQGAFLLHPGHLHYLLLKIPWTVFFTQVHQLYDRWVQIGWPTGAIMAIEKLLTGNIGSQVKELMATEDILLEAVRDLVKDEIKTYIRDKVESDAELKEELKDAISYYFNAKARSLYAELKASRAAARLGLRILPEDLQGEVGEALVGLFERELGNLLEKAL